MANKEEIIAKIDELLPEEAIDEKIELMEKVDDSIGENNDSEKDVEIERLKAENESLKKEVKELKIKYKERFMKSDESEEIASNITNRWV